MSHRQLSLCLLGAITILASQSAYSETCTIECHPSLKKLKNLHQPVTSGECLACHIQHAQKHPGGGKAFHVPIKGSALCDQCHGQFGKKKVVHQPVKDGECLACHNPHGGSGRSLLDSVDQMRLCTKCHDRTMFDQKFMHGPVAIGECSQCHNPHETDEPSLVKKKPRDMCLSCHADFGKAMNAAGFVHPPVKDQPCTSCHSPHGAAHSYLLKNKMPELCIGCHRNIGHKMKAKNVHKPVVGEKSCGACHSSHFSKARGLLAGDEKNACLVCHGQELKDSSLKNIGKELEGKKNIHAPIAGGQCSVCHDPHGSDFFRLLTASYPEAFYAPFSNTTYDACLRCHDKNLLKYQETTIYTKFRNGKQNLHYIHVSDKRKGRSCRACHNAHASDGKKLISQSGADFGEWKIPSRFEITTTGGSCAPGCHRPLQYDREKPVDYSAGINPKE